MAGSIKTCLRFTAMFRTPSQHISPFKARLTSERGAVFNVLTFPACVVFAFNYHKNEFTMAIRIRFAHFTTARSFASSLKRVKGAILMILFLSKVCKKCNSCTTQYSHNKLVLLSVLNNGHHINRKERNQQ